MKVFNHFQTTRFTRIKSKNVRHTKSCQNFEFSLASVLYSESHPNKQFVIIQSRRLVGLLEKLAMLKELFSRYVATSSIRILTGAFIVVLSSNYTFAQFSSPATFGVYNRAATFGYGSQGQLPANGGSSPSSTSDAFLLNSGFNSNDLTASPLNMLSSEEQSVQVVEEPEFVYKGHDLDKPLLSVKFYKDSSFDGYAVLSGSGDTTARLWLLTGEFDPQTTEWSITKANLQKTFKDVHKQGVTKAIFSPDSSYVLTSSYDQVGRLWLMRNEENIRAYTGAKDRLWSISVSPSGDYVAGACNDGRVYFWESLTVQKLATLPNNEEASLSGNTDVGHIGPVFDVAFDPTSSFVATAGADGTVRIWNLGLLRQVAVLKGHEDKVYSVTFSPDGSYILTASRDKTARLWNPSTGDEVCRFVGHTGGVRQAIFANSSICTASDDGTVRLWNVNDVRSKANASSLISGSSSMGSEYGSSMGGSGASSKDVQSNASSLPSRKEGFKKGVELVRFEANSPVFSVDVSEDEVYVCGACQDGTGKIWRMPNAARYFDDNSYQGNSQNYYLGTDPMRETGIDRPGMNMNKK